MTVTRRSVIGSAAITALSSSSGRAHGNNVPTIRIGVLTDLSGPYRDMGGPIAVACVRQAVQEFTTGSDMKVEVVAGDFQNKADVGASIARQWFDEQGVDVVVDVLNSSVALAVSSIAREKNKVALVCPATTELTGRQCSPNTIHWSHDTWMLAKSTAGSILKSGGDSWFLIEPNYAFGHQLAQDATRFIVDGGGKVLGSATYPFPDTTDSPLSAQALAPARRCLVSATAAPIR